MTKDLTDHSIDPVDDVPTTDLGVERDMAMEARLYFEEAAYHFGEMAVTLDGIADEALSAAFDGRIREMQKTANEMREEADAFAAAWGERENALRERIAKLDVA